MKKQAAIVLFALLLILSAVMPAAAASQDGIEAVISTSSQSYKANEDIVLKLTLKNTSKKTAEDVSAEITLPSELTLKEGSLKSDVFKLSPGEEKSITLTAIKSESVQANGAAGEGVSGIGGNGGIYGSHDSSDTTAEPTDTTAASTETDAPESAAGTTAPDSDTAITDQSKTDTKKASDEESGSSGLVIGIIIGVVALAAIAGAAVLVFKKKHAGAALSIILCIALLGSGGAAISAEAASLRNSLTVTHNVTVNDRSYTVKAKVSYSFPEETVSVDNEYADNWNLN